MTRHPHIRPLGFSLIELMMVIAIIGILAAIAIPSYSTYLIRARVSEALTAGDLAKTAVSEFVMANAYNETSPKWPTNNQQAALPPSIDPGWGNRVTNLSVSLNVIMIQVDAHNTGIIAPLNIYLNGTYANGGVIWACGADGAVQYAPITCRP